jgi:predicted nucleotidyltransferase
MKTRTILTSYHGSHLYGMATPKSDVDIYTVYEFINQRYRPHLRKQAKQTISEKDKELEDKMVVSWDRFSDFCIKGVPQACEVLFSHPENWIEFHPDWLVLSESLKKRVTNRFNIYQVLNTYKKTAYNFAATDDFKKNRHAMRLCINAKELLNTGVMNPTLDDYLVTSLTSYAMLPYEYRLEVMKNKYLSVFDKI